MSFMIYQPTAGSTDRSGVLRDGAGAWQGGRREVELVLGGDRDVWFSVLMDNDRKCWRHLFYAQ